MHGEAGRDRASDEACGPPHEHQGIWMARRQAGACTPLLEAALKRKQRLRAWKRVKPNKGAAGVDGSRRELGIPTALDRLIERALL